MWYEWGRSECIHSLMGKPEGKRPRVRCTCILEYNIKIDLKEVGGCVLDYLTQDGDQWLAVLNTVVNLGVS